MLLLTKCDRVMDEDRPVLLKTAEKNDAVLAGNIYCVSNRSNENPHPLSDESEQAWFTENLPDFETVWCCRIQENNQQKWKE